MFPQALVRLSEVKTWSTVAVHSTKQRPQRKCFPRAWNAKIVVIRYSTDNAPHFGESYLRVLLLFHYIYCFSRNDHLLLTYTCTV